ncbi:hypothetical protein R3P38DRAFT_2541128, partial [Favolaschia claudopus]
MHDSSLSSSVNAPTEHSVHTTHSDTRDDGTSVQPDELITECNTVLPSNGRQISIRCWNINGRLASNLSHPAFVSEISKYDVILFQETHLLPDQELSLPLPPGYDIYAVAREPSCSTFDKPWGGVLTMVRSDLNAEKDESLSGPDLLVLRLGCLSLFNAYILPHGSPWAAWSPIAPIDKLNQSVAVARFRGDAVCVNGDLNGRTACRRVDPHAHPPRFSMDNTVNTQGREILQLADDHNLRILNGDVHFGNGSWGWTFCQKRVFKNGTEKWCRSVIDYALCDSVACEMVQNFEVLPVGPWSDHAPLVLDILLPDSLPPTNPGKEFVQARRREANDSNAYLDVLLRETVESKPTPQQKQARFYGPVYDDAGRSGVQVYTDGSCLHNGMRNARAGAGVYFGPNSPLNASLRVHGDQTNNRGELLAILYAIYSAPSNRALTVYSDSQLSIRSIVYWAPRNAEMGWKCANADILKDIVSWIRFRTAPVRFVYVKAHAGNSHNEAADKAAKNGALIPLCSNSYISHPAPPPLPREGGYISTKVSCDIPESSEAPPVHPPPPDSPPPDPYCYAPHHGRTLRRRLEKANRDRLTKASSNSAAFWKVYRSMTDPKPRPPAVSLAKLAQCFQSRMNTKDPPPKEFNTEYRNAVEDFSHNIPTASQSLYHEGETFSRPVTVEDIEWAKEHLRTHYNTAAGVDGLHYAEIMAIENEALCKLINECINRNDAPVVWFTAIIAAIPKKDKPLSVADSYRTVGLESCFLKLVCLLIHKRIYSWAEQR